MRTASRFMQRAPAKRLHPLGFVILVAFVIAYGYGLWKAPVALIGVTLVMVALAVVRTVYERRQLTRLAEGRRQESICTFARAFDLRSSDPWVVRAVYEQLEEHLSGHGVSLPIRPEDRLREDLRLDDDDLDLDLARDIAARTGRPLIQPEKNPYYGKVTTVRDLVEFFCAQSTSAT